MSVAQWNRLEERVTSLEAWAGPGQIRALLDGQQELRAGMAKVQATLSRHDRLLSRLKTDMSSVKDTLARHEATLDQHTAILDQHTAILGQHTAILGEHTVALDSLQGQVNGLVADMAWVKQSLGELLARIPEQPSQN
jgi:chromosome segregation ATPase